MTVKHSGEEGAVKEDEVNPSGEQEEEEEHSQTTSPTPTKLGYFLSSKHLKFFMLLYTHPLLRQTHFP